MQAQICPGCVVGSMTSILSKTTPELSPFCPKILQNLCIHAYVIMPNHIHLIVSDTGYDNDRLGKTLTEFRKFTGNKLANYIDANLSDALALVTRGKQLQDRIRQVWQPG